MADIEVYEVNGVETTNSKNVAEVFGKSHRDVTRDIRNLDCSDDFRARNFAQSSYTSKQNKELPCVEMTKDGFTFLCMGYTGKKAAQFKEAYIAEFNSMANTLNSLANRINAASKKTSEIEGLGREWSELGRMVNREKKKHKQAIARLMEEVQIKIEF